MKKKPLILVLLLPLLLAAAFLLYTGQYYHAKSAALSALESDETVRVTRMDYGWHFDGPSSERALIFYPGAKVEETAYAPFLRLLAQQGMDVCLVRMPFRLAFFGVNLAERVMARHDYARWYVGGHSLGGAMAAAFAASRSDLDGVILCAAYPTKPLPAGMTEILLYGSQDLVLNRKNLEKGRQYAPARFVEHVIEGGNHAQFGCYGAQSGDGTAAMPAQAQQEEAVRVILESLSPSLLSPAI